MIFFTDPFSCSRLCLYTVDNGKIAVGIDYRPCVIVSCVNAVGARRSVAGIPRAGYKSLVAAAQIIVHSVGPVAIGSLTGNTESAVCELRSGQAAGGKTHLEHEGVSLVASKGIGHAPKGKDIAGGVAHSRIPAGVYRDAVHRIGCTQTPVCDVVSSVENFGSRACVRGCV